MNYFTHTIRLSEQLQGKDIVTLVQMACQANGTKFACETYVHNGYESYRVGQHSSRATQRFRVLPGDGDVGERFEEERGYRRVTIVEHPEAHEAYLDQTGNAPLIAAGRYFVEAFEKTLRPNR